MTGEPVNPDRSAQSRQRETASRHWYVSAGFILLALVVLALLIRVAAFTTRDTVQLDETAYLSMARNLAAGNGLLDITGESSTYFSPLLPMLITGVAAVLGDYILSAHLVVAVFGALMLIPVFLLAREFAGERAALLAAALAAVMPLFVQYSSLVYSESVYTFFLLMGIFFGWQMLTYRRLRCGLATGICLGLAYLANPAAVFYLAALLLLAGAVAIVKGGWGSMARSVGMFLLAFLVFAVPYVLFLHAELGRWTYTGKYVDVNLYDAVHNLRLGTEEWEQDLLSLSEDGREVKVNTLPNDVDLLSFIVQNPKVAARIFAEQSFVLYSDLLPKVLPLWLLPLLGLGLFARGWDRRRAARYGYLLLMMAPVILVLAMYAHDRFFVPFVALATVWMGAGWARLEAWGKDTAGISLSGAWRSRLQNWFPWLIAAAVLLPTLGFTGFYVMNDNEAVEFREAGVWLKDSGGGDLRIMNRESSSAYFSESTPVFLPYAGYEETTAYAEYQDIDYLVISRKAIIDWRPQLAVLLDDESRHPQWQLVHIVRPGTDRETLIFRHAQAPGLRGP